MGKRDLTGIFFPSWKQTDSAMRLHVFEILMTGDKVERWQFDLSKVQRSEISMSFCLR